MEQTRPLTFAFDRGRDAPAKLHGLLIDRKELAGKADAPISREVVHKLDDASAKWIADLMK